MEKDFKTICGRCSWYKQVTPWEDVIGPGNSMFMEVELRSAYNYKYSVKGSICMNPKYTAIFPVVVVNQLYTCSKFKAKW